MLISQLPTTIAPNDPEHIAASDVVHAALKTILGDDFIPTLTQINDVNGNKLMGIVAVNPPTGYFQFVESGGGYPGSSFVVQDDVNAFSQMLVGVKGEATFAEEVAESGAQISIAGHIEGTLNAICEFTPAVGGVNFFRLVSAATGIAPKLRAVGPDANVGLDITMQGDIPDLRIFADFGQNNRVTAIFHNATGGTNYPYWETAAPGADIAFEARGTSADIGINYRAKGTGVHRFNSGVRVGTDHGGEAGYTTFTSASGTPSDTATPTLWLKVYYGASAGYVPWHAA